MDPTDLDAVVASERLAGDGETDDGPALQSLIQSVAADGGGLILLDRPDACYDVDTLVAPETDGERVVIRGVGSPEIDVSDVRVGTGESKLDFHGSPNVQLHDVTVTGRQQHGMEFGVGAGDGFRFSNLVFDTGQGGLNVDHGASDVHGRWVTAVRQHDLDHGWAGGVHVGRSEDVRIEGIDVRDCDRGIECDDGPRDLTLRHGYVRDIDNSGADNAVEYTFTLDVHVHPDHPHVRHVRLEDFTLVNCARGFSARAQQSPDQIRDVAFRDVRQVDCPAPDLEADVVAEGVELEAEETTPRRAATVYGASVTLRDWTVRYAPTETHVRFEPGVAERRCDHGRHVVENFRVDADGDGGAAGLTVEPETGIDELTVRDYRSGDVDGAAVSVPSGALDPAGRGATLRDCHLGGGVEAAATGGPVALRGGSCAGRVEAAGAATARDVDGLATEARGRASADPDAGRVEVEHGLDGEPAWASLAPASAAAAGCYLAAADGETLTVAVPGADGDGDGDGDGDAVALDWTAATALAPDRR